METDNVRRDCGCIQKDTLPLAGSRREGHGLSRERPLPMAGYSPGGETGGRAVQQLFRIISPQLVSFPCALADFRRQGPVVVPLYSVGRSLAGRNSPHPSPRPPPLSRRAGEGRRAQRAGGGVRVAVPPHQHKVGRRPALRSCDYAVQRKSSAACRSFIIATLPDSLPVKVGGRRGQCPRLPGGFAGGETPRQAKHVAGNAVFMNNTRSEQSLVLKPVLQLIICVHSRIVAPWCGGSRLAPMPASSCRSVGTNQKDYSMT